MVFGSGTGKKKAKRQGIKARSHRPTPGGGSDPYSALILDFLKFIETQPRQSLRTLFDRILQKSRELCRAEAGTLFICTSSGGLRRLYSFSVQNDRVRVPRSAFVLPLEATSIAGYVAHSGRSLRIADVARIPAHLPYKFNAARDPSSYKSRSMFCFPLKDFKNRVNGVVQLINALDPNSREVVPFPPEVEKMVSPMTRVVGQWVERHMMLDHIAARNRQLRKSNQQLLEQKQHILALQEETEEAFQLSIRLLARAAELHDKETGGHIQRVNEFSYVLARLVAMPEDWCRCIRYSAQLHDVGKMSVDSALLRKTGPLNKREKKEMKQHTIYGQAILSGNPRLKMGAEIALNHHEKWEGGGYPNGKRGEEIPLSARIVQLADIYDALRSKRPYKRAFSHAQVLRVMTQGDERLDPKTHFDPKLLKVFQQQHQEFDRVWRETKKLPPAPLE